MDYFIVQAKIILPSWKWRSCARRQLPSANAEAVPASSAGFELHLKRDGISDRPGDRREFTMLEGSSARMAWTSVEHAYKVLHEKLLREGAIVPSTDARMMRLARDQVFASPSAAAAAATGRATVQASATATGKPRELTKLPERDRCSKRVGHQG